MSPQDKYNYEYQQKQERIIFNPTDPYYRQPNFRRLHSQVRNTKEHLRIISPRDHSEMKGKTPDEIQQESLNNMKEVLCLEKHFTNFNLALGEEVKSRYKHHDLVRLPPKQLVKAAREANYFVKIDPDEPENEKLMRLSRTFCKNPELTAVQLKSDVDDYENTTHEEFNYKFENQIKGEKDE